MTFDDILGWIPEISFMDLNIETNTEAFGFVSFADGYHKTY